MNYACKGMIIPERECRNRVSLRFGLYKKIGAYQITAGCSMPLNSKRNAFLFLFLYLWGSFHDPVSR